MDESLREQSSDRGSSGNRMPQDINAATEGSKAGLAVIEEILGDLQFPQLTAEEEVARSKERFVGERLKLTGRHYEIMRQVLEGATYTQIAAVMGMASQSVALICNSQIFREELAKLEAKNLWDVSKRADNLSNEALSTLRNLMRESRSEVRRESAADKILGIAGYSKIEKKVVGVVDGEAVIRELNRRRRERQASANEPRDG